MKKIMILSLSFLMLILAPLSSVQADEAKDKKAPKCEKCYRGPDGKIVCEQIPCPEKK